MHWTILINVIPHLRSFLENRYSNNPFIASPTFYPPLVHLFLRGCFHNDSLFFAISFYWRHKFTPVPNGTFWLTGSNILVGSGKKVRIITLFIRSEPEFLSAIGGGYVLSTKLRTSRPKPIPGFDSWLKWPYFLGSCTEVLRSDNIEPWFKQPQIYCIFFIGASPLKAILRSGLF